MTTFGSSFKKCPIPSEKLPITEDISATPSPFTGDHQVPPIIRTVTASFKDIGKVPITEVTGDGVISRIPVITKAGEDRLLEFTEGERRKLSTEDLRVLQIFSGLLKKVLESMHENVAKSVIEESKVDPLII